MMECKRALIEANGDEDLAIELLRKSGKKTMEKRGGRETEAGRIAICFDEATGITAMVELLCESAPVAGTDEFGQLIANLASQLAKGPGAKTAEELLAQPVPGNPNRTLQEEYDDLVNKIREVFKLNRMTDLAVTDALVTREHGDIPELLEKQWSSDTRRHIPMKLLCKGPARVAILEYLKGKIVEERENGDFILLTHGIENERMWYSLLLGFGDSVEVLEPREVIEMLKEKSLQIQKLYKD